MAVAEVLDFTTGDTTDDGSVGAAVNVVLDRLRGLPVDEGAAQARAAIRRLEMAETEMVARKLDAGATPGQAARTAGAGGDRSKRDAKKVKQRAEAVRQNPSLGDDANRGELSTGQLDVLAEAAARTDGEAARDPELIEAVKNTENPDQARQTVRDWEDARADQDDLDETHRRHRAKRGMRRFVTKRGTSALMLEGDKTSIDQMETSIAGRADQLYWGDGGRDLPHHRHPRTHNQRCFDAAHDLLTPGGGTNPERNRDAADDTSDATPTTTAHNAATGSTDTAPKQPAAAAKTANRIPPPRAAIHITASVNDLYLPGAVTRATLLGSGPLPTPELERFGCYADLVGTIFSGTGEVLWQGRRVRAATPAQWDALIARDRGCVLCGAAPGHCEAHHIIPWNAPARGPTDIDHLALVCGACHRHIHNTALTLHWTPHGWRTRPATPGERAPSRGPTNRRGP